MDDSSSGEDDSQDENDLGFQDDTNINHHGNMRVTKRMVQERGADPQGIPWDRLETSREEYRRNRLREYPHYENLQQDQRNISNLPPESHAEVVESEKVDKPFFEFYSNERAVRSSIVHFQLRNLVWATSAHDVYVTYSNEILHYSYLTRTLTPILRVDALAGQLSGRLQISTMCVHDGVCLAGGFYGEMVCVRVPQDLADHQGRRDGCGEGVVWEHLTRSENAITNAILLSRSRAGSLQAVISNNDSFVRVRDVEAGMREVQRIKFDWPVNFSAVDAEGRTACVVGDAAEALVVDLVSGQTVARCEGHRHYSFAADFHPGGYLMATGSQDKTCRVWDRRTWRCLAVLRARLGAVRALRFSSDGALLAAAEPADFVHLYDVSANMREQQELDLFGEIAGISFSPEAGALFVGVADRTYGSMLHYRRRRH